MSNPFTLSFGREPASLITRAFQNEEIISSFMSETPAYQVCMITGVRGSGKTVFMTTIANTLKVEKNWIVVNLNPDRDLLHTLAAELSNRKELLEYFRDAKINLSFLGFGLEIDGEPPVTDIVVAITRMLEKLTAHGKNVLITIDEVTSTKQLREFASQFQIFMREGLKVYLLMTGLYENIYELQNEKTLTFLYRAPRIELRPLNLLLIAAKYRDIFCLTEKEAMEMAKVTRGYSFAFQVLGYLCWSKQTKWENVLLEYDAYLEEFVYEKIWSELSGKDREVLQAMSVNNAGKVKIETLREQLAMSSNSFNSYRTRLIRKGLVESLEYGYLDFTLPRFREYILRYIE